MKNLLFVLLLLPFGADATENIEQTCLDRITNIAIFSMAQKHGISLSKIRVLETSKINWKKGSEITLRHTQVRAAFNEVEERYLVSAAYYNRFGPKKCFTEKAYKYDEDILEDMLSEAVE